MAEKIISLNGTTVAVVSKDKEPLRLTATLATTTSASGEELEVLSVLGAPLVFVLRGEKLSGTIDVTFMVQEALLHILRENAQ